MIVFDEFPVDALRAPNGDIDSTRFPNFARLARMSSWFVNAYASHDSTPQALPAVLDGRLPRAGPRATAEGHPKSVFTLFGDRGYRVVSSEEASDVCPNRLCPGAARRRKGVLSNLENGRRRRFDAWMEEIRRRRQPTFYFKHVLLPHLPWIFLPSGRELLPTVPRLANPRGFHDRTLTEHNQQRFLLQVGFVDREIGRLLRRLSRQGLLDQATIVLTADHGIAFELGVSDRRKVTESNFDEVGPVPFFIKAPGQRSGEVVRTYVRTIDVVPTVADALDVPLRWADGRSGFDTGTRRSRLIRIPTRFFERTLVFDGPALERRRRRIIRHWARLFGAGEFSELLFGSPWTSVYRIGPRPELIGARLSRLRVTEAGSPTANLAGGPHWNWFDPGSRIAPVQVAGQVLGAGQGERRFVAAAVNGRVQAVGRTFYLQGNSLELFSVLVPESSLRPGRNRVELFEVQGRGRSLRLRRLAST
jgi:hypothetical protein